MRITFVLPCFSTKPMGGVRVVYAYADGLARRGHDVAIVHAAFLEPRQYLGRLRPSREAKVFARGLVDSVRHRPAGPAWQVLDPGVRLSYVPTLSASNVPDSDVVVATAWRTAESVARYPAAKGRKHYLIQHYEVWDGTSSRVNATWRSPMHKIVIADWLHRKAQAFGVGSEEIVRLPGPGIDLAPFGRVTATVDRPDRVAMLWSSAPVKGGADGLAALEAAREQVPDLQAVLFGVRARPAGLPAWIEYLQNPPLDRLAGHVYGGSSIYLCPSWSEGWHLPPAEAMASGCALVSTDIQGVSDYAISGLTAVLAPVRDVAGMAAGIVRLCRDPEERVQMALAGRELISTFTVERSLDVLELSLQGSEVRR